MGASASSNPRYLLTAIIVVSIALRVGAALVMGNQVSALPGIADQISYNTLALRVLDGHGFSFGQPWWPATAANAPTAHWSFLYTSYLVLVYGIFGRFPLIARLIQAIAAGFLQPLLVYLVSDRLFGRKASLIAAMLVAVYAYFVYYSAAIMTETFFIIFLLLVMLIALRFAFVEGQGRLSNAGVGAGRLGLYLGLGLGGLVLLRQAALLVAPVIWLWIAVVSKRQGRWRMGVVGIAISAGVLAASIIPWTLYNYQRFDQFVLLNTNAGFAFYLSNHPIYGTVFQPILSESVATYRSLIPTSLMGLNEAQLDHALLLRGMGFVFQDPRRFFLLSLSRIPVFFMFWPSPASSTFSNLSRTLSFGLMWPFMLGGLGLTIRKHGLGRFLMSGAGLLLSVTVVYTGVHLISWSLIRYRIPLDALMLPFAGVCLQEAWMWLSQRRRRTSAPRSLDLSKKIPNGKRGS
jgi:4-amino-4-deoxy-L-arabinose transferase-like glycosyltransferase